MRLEAEVEVLLADLDSEGRCGIGEVACRYGVAFCRLVGNDGCVGVVSASVTYHLVILADELAEMLYCVIFWSISECRRCLCGCGNDLNESVL